MSQTSSQTRKPKPGDAFAMKALGISSIIEVTFQDGKPGFIQPSAKAATPPANTLK